MHHDEQHISSATNAKAYGVAYRWGAEAAAAWGCCHTLPPEVDMIHVVLPVATSGEGMARLLQQHLPVVSAALAGFVYSATEGCVRVEVRAGQYFAVSLPPEVEEALLLSTETTTPVAETATDVWAEAIAEALLGSDTILSALGTPLSDTPELESDNTCDEEEWAAILTTPEIVVEPPVSPPALSALARDILRLVDQLPELFALLSGDSAAILLRPSGKDVQCYIYHAYRLTVVQLSLETAHNLGQLLTRLSREPRGG